MTSLQHFLSELKRRKVYRVAIVYAAVAFVIWQVADLALPYLGLPAAAVTFVLVLTLFGFPLALVLAWAYELRPEEPVPVGAPSPVPASAPARAAPMSPGAEPTRRPAARTDSIAVLPFENMSTEPESEYFADGISEELTHALGRMPELRVAARTSAFAFKGERLDVREIGARLNVGHVVEGSVRRSGDRLRITAQLIDTRDGYHVWSDRFERQLDDVFAIQDDIVEAVVDSLVRTLHGSVAADAGAPALSRTDHLDAYDLYLRARHALRAFDGSAIREAVDLCEQAIGLDPSFAPAHATLADALTMQAIGFFQGPGGAFLPRARAAAERALALDPNLPAAHLARALSLMYHDWAYPEAREAFERALSLNPSFADAYRWFEFYWTYVEHDYEQAVSALKEAGALDPMDGRLPLREATVEFIFGNFDRAERILREVAAAEGESPILKISLMDTLIRAGRDVEAVELARSLPVAGAIPDVFLGVAGLTLVLGGSADECRARLQELERRAEQAYSLPFWRAVIYAALGDLDRAFALLDTAAEDRDAGLLFLSVVPKVPGFQTDPRYVALLRRIGLGHLVASL